MKNRNGKLFVILAAVLLLVMGFAISTFAGNSQNYWVTQSLNVSTYRANTDTNGHYTKYPTCTLTGYEGYVFAGWFTDETCETPYTKATGTAYAKFVPEEIFGIKAQVSGTLVDDNRTNDETGAIRFITSIDSLDYAGIGFEVYYNGAYQSTSTLNMSGAAYADYIYLQNSSVITLKGNLTASKKMSIICDPCTAGKTIIKGDYVAE